MEDVVARLEDVYKNVDGYGIARGVIKQLKASGQYEAAVGLQYGEISFKGFSALLEKLGKEPFSIKPTRFADLGSGTGKAVLLAAAYLNCPSLGVEIVKELHAEAEAAKERWNSHNPGSSQSFFVCGDIFSAVESWKTADFVYVSSTCFTDEMMVQLEDALTNLADGSIIVMTTRKLTNSCFQSIHKDRYVYGKGNILFTVYRKMDELSAPKSSGENFSKKTKVHDDAAQ